MPPPGTDPIHLEAPPGTVIAAAVGAALAERMLAGRFGRSLVDHRTWVLAGATELAAGAAHEAAAIAGAVPLDRLTIVATLPEALLPTLTGFAAHAWAVRKIPAGDTLSFETALTAAARARKPTLIACLGPPSASERAADPEPHPRATAARRGWLKRQRRHGNAELFARMQANRLPPGGIEAVAAHSAAAAMSPAEAVRTALSRLAPAWPEVAGLAPDGCFAAAPALYAGRTVAWGGRAQASAGGLLGMALHGGLLPFAGHGHGAVEALLPTLRIAAERGLRMVHLVREAAPLPDGIPAALRALQDSRLFRPANAAEALECLALALRHVAAPSVLLLSDHVEPPFGIPARACARGGYALHDAAHRDVTLIASGADLSLALAVGRGLAAAGVAAACVSLPCWQLFMLQDAAYRDAVLGAAPRIALDSGIAFGWTTLLGPDGMFIDTRANSDIVAFILRALRQNR